jgi:glycosyltransferase involved in cell wall biosynthesis
MRFSIDLSARFVTTRMLQVSGVHRNLADGPVGENHSLRRHTVKRIESSVRGSAHLRIVTSNGLTAGVSDYARADATVMASDAGLAADPLDRVRARLSLSLPLRPSLLVFTGTLRPLHGLEIAISALAHLADDVHLVVAGDGYLKPELIRHAHQLAVAHRVHWLGTITHDRIPALLAAGDIALAPYPALIDFSYSPLKLYKYLRAGIPVIASDVGQVAHVLNHGRRGRLVTPGDPRALASSIRAELSDPTIDRKFARKAGRAGWERDWCDEWRDGHGA